jgi:hypothetical protein
LKRFIRHGVKFQKTFKLDMHKNIKSLAFSDFNYTDKIKRRLSHLCIHFFGGLLYSMLKLHKHSIYSTTDEMKRLVLI